MVEVIWNVLEGNTKYSLNKDSELHLAYIQFDGSTEM